MTATGHADGDRGSDAPPQSPMCRQVLVLCITGILIAISSVGLVQHVSIDERSDFFASVSQVIATLFIAIVFESFSAGHGLWQRDVDRWAVLVLLAFSLLGLFTCFRGLLGETGGLAIGVATAGLLSSACLVCLALLQRLRAALPCRPETMLLFFVAPSTLAFAIL